MPRLLHLADLHLGWAPHDLPPAVAEARRAARDARLDEAVALALRERVDAVVIVGDLFERYDPPSALVARARSALARLTDAGVAVVTIPGNHDELTYPGSVFRRELDRWPGIVVRDAAPARVATFELGGERVHVHALAFIGGVSEAITSLAELPARDDDGYHLFAAHGTLVNAALELQGDRSLPLPRAVLAAAGYDYVALGHIHRPSEQRLGRSLAVYPGCVGGKGFDDPGSGAWTIVHLGPQGARTEHVAHSGQRLHDLELDVGAYDDAAALRAALMSLLAPLADDLVRVRLTGAAPVDIDAAALSAECAQRALFLRIEDRTTSISESLLDVWAASPTVRGAFVRRLREGIAASSDEQERRRLQRALRFGLDAMSGDA